MAGYPPRQDGVYISPDVHIPSGMAAYPVLQPPTMVNPLPPPHPSMLGGAPRSQQPGYPTLQPHHAPVYYMPPPPPHHHQAPPQYRHPYPPLPPQQQQQQQQFNTRNDGSTTVMLPVTFTPGMAPFIHSAISNRSGGVGAAGTIATLNQNQNPPMNSNLASHQPLPPFPLPHQQRQQQPPQQQFPGFHQMGHGIGNGMLGSMSNGVEAGPAAAGGGNSTQSPRYLSMGPPPLPVQLPYQQQLQTPHHQYLIPGPAPNITAGANAQVWPGRGGGTAAVAMSSLPRMSPAPPPHPRTHSGQDFQATIPSGITGPLNPQVQLLPPSAAAAGGRASPLPGGPPVEEQSADSAPQRLLAARNRAQPHAIQGYKSQNDDLVENAAAAAGAGPSSAANLHKAHTSPAGAALVRLAEAAAAAAPETSRASRNSARQQQIRTMKQNEIGLAGGAGGGGGGCASGGGGGGNGKRAGPGSTSEALRKELGAALLGSDTNNTATAVEAYQQYPRSQPAVENGAPAGGGAVAAESMHLPSQPLPILAQQQQQQRGTLPQHQHIPQHPATVPAVPSSVLQNLSRALADLSRMTAGTTGTTTPRVASVAYPAASTQPPVFNHPGGSNGHSAPHLPHPPAPAQPLPHRPLATSQGIPSSSLPYNMQPPPSGYRFIPPPGQHQQHLQAPMPMPPPPHRHPLPPSITTTAATAATSHPLQQQRRPAAGPRLSRPLTIENPCFGPGVSFPNQLKRKRTNMSQPPMAKYSKKKAGTAGGAGGVLPGAGGQIQKPTTHPYYLPITTGRLEAPRVQPAAGAGPPNHNQHLFASFPTTTGEGNIQGQMIPQMMQKNLPGAILPPSSSLPKNIEAQEQLQLQMPPPSPQPAPSQFQRSSVSTIRAEPMVRIVRDISSASQLQRLQVDSKMERSLLLPPVPPPPPPPLSGKIQQYQQSSLTSTTPITRGALLSAGKSAAVAVALAVNASPVAKKKVLTSPKKQSTKAADATTKNPSGTDIGNQQPQDQSCHYPDEFTSLFKMNLTVIDESDQAWPVIYEGLACSGQRHVRLSSGWHAMMKGLGVVPGDKIVLERWTEDRTVLHILVLEASEEQRAAAAAGAGAVVGTGNAGVLSRPAPPRPLQEGGKDDVTNKKARNRKNIKGVQIKTIQAPSKRTRH